MYETRAQKYSSIVTQGSTITKQLRKRWNRKICKTNLNDYNEWLSKMADKMEETDRVGDSETIFHIVKLMIGLMQASSTDAPSTDKNGDLILDQKTLAKTWKDFLEGKFKETEAEKKRDPLEDLGPQLIVDPLTEFSFVRALEKLKKGKACGPDGIPGEVFCECESAVRELYRILNLIWSREYVPPELVRSSFVMLYNRKGIVNDPSKYRYIGLLLPLAPTSDGPYQAPANVSDMI